MTKCFLFTLFNLCQTSILALQLRQKSIVVGTLRFHEKSSLSCLEVSYEGSKVPEAWGYSARPSRECLPLLFRFLKRGGALPADTRCPWFLKARIYQSPELYVIELEVLILRHSSILLCKRLGMWSLISGEVSKPITWGVFRRTLLWNLSLVTHSLALVWTSISPASLCEINLINLPQLVGSKW